MGQQFPPSTPDLFCLAFPPAKKDFRSSRAASDSTFKYNDPEIISGLLFYHNLQNLLNLRENYHQELS